MSNYLPTISSRPLPQAVPISIAKSEEDTVNLSERLVPFAPAAEESCAVLMDETMSGVEQVPVVALDDLTDSNAILPGVYSEPKHPTWGCDFRMA